MFSNSVEVVRNLRRVQVMFDGVSLNFITEILKL